MKKTNNLADFDRLFGDEIKEVQKEYPNYLSHDPDIKTYIINREKDLKAKIKKDLINIADKGEYEDLRREVENYFKK